MTAAMRGLILFFMALLFRFSGCSPRRPFCRAGRVAFRGQNKASPRTETDRGDTGMNGKLMGAFALLEKDRPRLRSRSADDFFRRPAVRASCRASARSEHPCSRRHRAARDRSVWSAIPRSQPAVPAMRHDTRSDFSFLASSCNSFIS